MTVKEYLEQEIETCKEQCCNKDLQEKDRFYIIGRKEVLEELLNLEGMDEFGG